MDLTAKRDKMGRLTSYRYDQDRRLTLTTNALQSTGLAYCDCGGVSAVTNALGAITRYDYDNQGRLTCVHYPDGTAVTNVYNALGQLEARLSARGSSTYVYNNQGLVIALFNSLGQIYQAEYDAFDRPVSVTDASGLAVSQSFDLMGRLLTRSYPDGTVERFENGYSGLIAYANRLNYERHFQYNPAGNLARRSWPSGKDLLYDYTATGQLLVQTNGNDLRLDYGDDLFSRLTTVSTNSVVKLRKDYNALGAVTNLTSPHAVLSSSPDALGRLTNLVCQITNLPSPFVPVRYKIENQYDALGNVRTQMVTGLSGWSGSISITNGFDTMNRLTQVAQKVNGTLQASASYAYETQAGRLLGKTYGNGDQVTYLYDPESRWRSLEATNAGIALFQFGFNWDNAGNLINLTNGSTLTTYRYDLEGQLTNEVYGSVNNRWVCDAAGNIRDMAEPAKQALPNPDDELTLSSANVTTPVSGQVQPGVNNSKWFHTTAESGGVSALVNTNTGDFTLPNVPLAPGTNALVVTVTDVSGNRSQQIRAVINNRVEGFGYDGNGNRTKWTNGTVVWTYVWNWADQLTEVQSNSTRVLNCWYDGLGRRVAKEELVSGQTKRWIYVYSGWNVLAVLNESGSLRETYTRGAGLAGDVGTLIAVTHHTGSSVTPGTYYLHNNHRGDVVLSRSGTSTFGTHTYAAYGAIRSSTGTKASRFLFSSKELDESVGFYYYGFRFYDPNLQRWLSRDPIGEEGGLNLYRFCRNDPVTNIDRDGRDVYQLRRKANALCGKIDHRQVFIDDTMSGVNYIVNFNELGETVVEVKMSVEEYVKYSQKDSNPLRVDQTMDTVPDEAQALAEWFKETSPKQRYSFITHDCRSTYERARARLRYLRNQYPCFFDDPGDPPF